ncbi:hypothetical protein LX15_000462 [Streptoalloteichus tenebrarius]|uniref:TAXI family TRAP transporter solute-binding subunit n=1 Tax=Streptoalloteichus tenebrarius (strain ATCC 17920 / DSM 40477 / JCM 4838 / CBS 697.72 / NBRC 16177 / NCIMB 11028 / NRRL B-12390 / A12253. 1 / ISP 5477) TaxID=1933 RepID=A0ABT1HMR6_STRSD|nr:TAXI family TRAP transporter solute-binding subunit [Streptoalloteichus tenebrarius]MCP2256779.1 hypothetical protein [Streptoalloteichus tenebrarius]BFF00316.1 TAXI family TRAP transporter solute-binding subunit [Streptoalloteichus tenebrarius]
MPPFPRRTALALLAGLPLCAAGCTGSPPPVRRLTIGTGSADGVYFALGQVLARTWADQLGIRSEVRTTAGSVANIELLRSGGADVVFSQVDAAAEPTPDSPLRALARMHDDYMHVVVRRNPEITNLSELRGMRVSMGAERSGVQMIARRLLAEAPIDPDRDLQTERLSIDESVREMAEGRLDAFFWSGGLPTAGVRRLAEETPIQLLDLGHVLAALRRRYRVYDQGTIPASTYRLGNPVTTLVVRNLLLVRADMPDDLAEALTRGLFTALDGLARANKAAATIGVRAAIGTAPLPLHPGAERYYRDAKKQ